jgi:hypothetical protein
MPNNFVGHVDKWLMLSESESDYAIMFVRAWIPFNAWYCNHYPHHNNSDRPCLDEMKIDGNQFRAKICALLSGEFADAINFKQYLAILHNLLEQYPIPEADIKKRITFNNLYFRENITAPINIIRNRISYKVERLSNNSINVLIKNSRLTIHTYSHTKYDFNHFSSDLEKNNRPTREQRENVKSFFKQIDPKKPESLLSSNRTKSINANGILFIDDSDLLSQAIIEILYNLRCKLFHGELQPSSDNLKVYEPAYNMLRILLKSLK